MCIPARKDGDTRESACRQDRPREGKHQGNHTGKCQERSAQGVVIGKPAVSSKFARLKIGMTLPQVEKTIGRPTKQWTHPTGKVSIPFYFGPDRWVIQYSYKGEGVLTFNSGGEQLLTQIEVNKAE